MMITKTQQKILDLESLFAKNSQALVDDKLNSLAQLLRMEKEARLLIEEDYQGKLAHFQRLYNNLETIEPDYEEYDFITNRRIGLGMPSFLSSWRSVKLNGIWFEDQYNAAITKKELLSRYYNELFKYYERLKAHVKLLISFSQGKVDHLPYLYYYEEEERELFGHLLEIENLIQKLELQISAKGFGGRLLERHINLPNNWGRIQNAMLDPALNEELYEYLEFLISGVEQEREKHVTGVFYMTMLRSRATSYTNGDLPECHYRSSYYAMSFEMMGKIKSLFVPLRYRLIGMN